MKIYSTNGKVVVRVEKILPVMVEFLPESSEYKNFWAVWKGRKLVAFIGNGSETAPKEYVAWSSEGAFWISFGNSITDAIRKYLIG